jgi:hypothetical protein
MFNKTGATNSFKVYMDGVASVETSLATTTSYSIPSTCVADALSNCVLADGSEVTIPVTYRINGRLATGVQAAAGLYSVALEKINWNYDQTSTFMAGETDWRTTDVSFP